MSGAKTRIAQLSVEQRALVERRLHMRASRTGTAAAECLDDHRPARDSDFPVSAAQRRLWVAQRSDTTGSAYNIHGAVRLKGELHVTALEGSLAEIVRRHASLRTVFVEDGGDLLQRVLPHVPAPLELIDLSAVHQAEREETLQTALAARSRTSFDLARGPLFHFALLRENPASHVLAITLHHIVADAWSMNVFVSELQTLYAAYREGRRSPLPALPLQYADVALREATEAPPLEPSIEYWKRRLASAPPALDLAPGRRARPTGTRSGSCRTRRLPRHLASALRDLSRKHGLTLFTTTLALLKALLHHYTQKTDILVGAVYTNRMRPGTEKLIGFFGNMLVLRTDLSGGLSFEQLLARVRETVLDAFAHGHVPYERVIEELRAMQEGPSRSTEPLRIQVGLEVVQSDGRTVDLAGLEVNPVDVQIETAKTDLVLLVHDLPDCLLCRLEYDTELFTAADADRMLELFEELASAMSNQPGQPFMLVPLFRREVGEQLGVAPDAVRRYLPLTETQRDLYIGHLLNPDAGTHTPSCLGILPADLDLETWRRAFDSVVAGEEMAHIRLAVVRGHLFQAVGPDVTFGYDVIEVREGEDLFARAERVRLERLDLERGPVGRMTVMTGSGGCGVLFAVNHMFMDGHAIVMLYRAVARAYDTLREGREPAGSRNVFLDDVASGLGREDSAAVQRFWTAKLHGIEPLDALAVTQGEPRPIIIRREVDAGLLKDLRTLSQASGHSVPTVLMGIYAAVLGRIYASGAPFVIHTILGRRNARSRRAFGCFVGNLPYVFPEGLQGEDATVADWIGSVAEYRRELGPMDSVPASTVSRILGAEGTKFHFNYLPSAMLEIGGSSCVLYDLFSYSSDEVHLMARQEDQGLELKLCQDARRMGGREFLDRLARVIRQAADGVQRVADLDLLLPGEHDRAVPSAGHGETAGSNSFGQLFGAQAVWTPEAIAASCDGASLTYAELKHRADRVAGALAARGIGPESVVALLGGRGLDLLTAIVGVLEAGAAYLPLDPRHPEARWRQVLTESRCPIVLADPEIAGRLVSSLAGVPVAARPDVLPLGLYGGPTVKRIGRAFPENLAYVIYTSGSTGVPKGAMLEHRGMVNHLRIKIGELGLTPLDVVAQTASQGFDISVWQFLAPLVSGGRVEIVPDSIAFDPTRLFAEVDRAGVTVLETVPSLLRAALDHAEGSRTAPRLERLRLLMLTGEALPPALCRAWLERYPDIPVVNAYGPTECSDDVTHHVIASAPAADEARLPIGHPLTNMRLYVLDRAMRPAPPGVWGELYVGGAGVGRGYLNAPHQTAASFVPDPFGGVRGGRLYRTGDRVRLLDDGDFEFLGRVDHQIKIRGHRIELDEIRSVLSRQPGVRDCVVVTRTLRGEATESLVAYVVPDRAAPPATAELRAALRRTLPEYMVPSVVVALDALPLTPNGKLDRAALPEPDRDLRAASSSVSPRDLLERQLLEIWEELLTVRPIGVTDGFFDLGGHSLLAVRMLARIKERFGRDLPLATLFAGQTIEALADTLRGQIEMLPPSPLVALQPRGGKPPLFCVHPGSGNVLCFYHLARRFGPDRPVYGLQDPALYGEWSFDVPIERMAARYVQEIRTVQPEGPYHLIGWSYGGQVAFEMARQLTSAGSSIGLLAILDTGAPEGVDEFNRRADDAALMSIVVQEWGLPASAEEIRRLEPAVRLETLSRRLREEHGLTFAEPAWLGSRVERFQARLRVLETYRPDPYPGHILLLRAAATGIDDDVAADYPQDPTMGWHAFSTKGVAVQVVPGSHATMAAEPHVAFLVKQLEAGLSGSFFHDDAPALSQSTKAEVPC
jgi:amino acid adenylation domain-containing protein